MSVQAAQLGIAADKIEESLAHILNLGNRWNAVVLLDEADVYISERGDDGVLRQVVAAFPRVLENHTSTVFLTTNRIGMVDDAIASRCLARIGYAMPSVEDQRKIWRVLNRLNDVGLTDGEIDAIVEKHHDLSGRDIKQVLELSSLWAQDKGERVDATTVEFARTFLPTGTV